jgi:hypothetical protein
MDIPVRMRQIPTNKQNGESQIGLARQARSTRLAQTPMCNGYDLSVTKRTIDKRSVDRKHVSSIFVQ